MQATIQRLKRELDTDIAATDRQHVTIWLMSFSARTRLELNHPRTGPIGYQGVGFSGSPEIVFDNYVANVIEDLIERHLASFEASLPDIARPERERFIETALDLLRNARAQLRSRAADIKGRLLGNGFNPVPVPIRGVAVTSIAVSQSLKAKLKALQQSEFQRMMISGAALEQLDEAVAAMRAATEGARAKRTRRVSRLLAEEPFAPARDQLLANVDFGAFLAKAQSEEVELGEALPLPEEPIEELGVVIGLIDYLGQDEDQALDLAFNHYAVGSRNVDAWHGLVDQVIVPWLKAFKRHLQAQGKVETVPPPGNVIDLRNARGVISVQQGSSHSHQSVQVGQVGADVSALLEAFAEALAKVELSASVRAEADADIDTIRAQLKKKSPAHSVLKTAGTSLRAIVENIAATALTAPALASTAAQLWTAIGLGP